MPTTTPEDYDERYVNPVLLARARELRQPLTPAEKKVWEMVRRRQLGPYFRRQHPIWRFIVDFYCSSARLVVEVDGEVHADAEQMDYDAARTEWLEARGNRVIRFRNSEVQENMEAVLKVIVRECRKAMK